MSQNDWYDLLHDIAHADLWQLVELPESPTSPFLLTLT
jgi:hypothetical protein